MRRTNMTKLTQGGFVLLLMGLGQTVLAEKVDVPATIEGAQTVTAEQVLDLADEHEDLVIIDSRKAADRSIGYIPDSVALVNTDTNEATLAEAIPTMTTPVVFYCNGVKCHRSSDAVSKAAPLGYSNLYWFRGGFDEWKAKDLPVER